MGEAFPRGGGAGRAPGSPPQVRRADGRGPLTTVNGRPGAPAARGGREGSGRARGWGPAALRGSCGGAAAGGPARGERSLIDYIGVYV